MGTVSQLSGKRIIGVLAGLAEATDVNAKLAMDFPLQAMGYLKWFERAEDDATAFSRFDAPGASGDAPSPTNGSGSGNRPNTPAALPCRTGQSRLPIRMPIPAMVVGPRLANKAAAVRFSF